MKLLKETQKGMIERRKEREKGMKKSEYKDRRKTERERGNKSEGSNEK